MGRAFGPDSPPTITQSIPRRGSLGIGASNVSTERKRTAAGTFRRSVIRITYSGDSTLTPIQTFCGQGSELEIEASRFGRFVRIWKVCQEAACIVAKTFVM